MRRFPLYIPATTLLAVVVAITAVSADTAADTAIRVVVTNVRKAEGVLLAGVYSSPETWLSPTMTAGKAIPVPPDVLDRTITFEIRLPPGRYALSVMQDLNGNRKLDTNFMGIPTEPSGSSNDAPARWSAPKFSDAVFTVGSTPVELPIRLN